MNNRDRRQCPSLPAPVTVSMALGARDDAIVYGCTLYVISRGLLWQARAALLKGAIMTAFGIGVLVQVAVKIARGLTPTVEVMGAGGLLAFAANVFCLGPALAAPGRRHQHALGVGLLAERCGRQRGGARGGRRGRADGLAVAGPGDRPAGRGDVRSLGVPGHPRRIARDGPVPPARRLYCPAWLTSPRRSCCSFSPASPRSAAATSCGRGGATVARGSSACSAL
jgi:hypothetical protein